MATFGDLSPEAQLRELRATLSDEDRALMEAALEGAKAMGDDYLFGGRPDEGNDDRLWREARQGLEWRLRTRGVKRGEKAPRAVVQEAFADYVRGFMESNPGLDETFEVVFEGIFMSLEDDFVLPDPSEVAAAEAAARDSFAVELPSPPPAGRARKGKKGGKKKTRK